MAFNGLGMNLGNLSRLSPALTRSISPESFTGEKGKAGMATEGTGANCARELGRGLEDQPVREHQGRRDLHHVRHPGIGRDPAYLDDAGLLEEPGAGRTATRSCASTGMTRSGRRWSARSAISSPARSPASRSTGRWFRCRSA